ncbi:uncharacterized protein LOC117108349 [Anneissia japonica]|uniref:uncharacterized protein LOC117108349 n=1 Tax=Anneissia japonica TaxID=1529436 RepID=UPI0014257FDF|nr:uncharacterized protein LOC117108349 [Anneissia japonica]
MVYILYVPTCVVGFVIEAVPGQNVSLPCTVDQVNDQQTVRWYGHNDYISSGKMFNSDAFGTLKKFYALPGASDDYSLFIMIPDDIMIWSYLTTTYECRLVSNTDDDVVQELQTYELQIYQPECTIIQINGSTSVASCSYQNIQQFQATWFVKDVSVEGIRNCTSDICTLNYAYTSRKVNPQDLVCNVINTVTMRKSKCSIKETHIPTLLPKTEASMTALTSTTIQVQPHSTLNILKEDTTTDIPDSDSNQKQGFITMVQFTIATACTSTMIFVLFINEFY